LKVFFLWGGGFSPPRPFLIKDYAAEASKNELLGGTLDEKAS